MEISERHIYFLGLAMIFFVVTTFGFNAFFQLVTRDAAKKAAKPIMELEFVKTTADIEAITEKKPEAHNALKTFLLLDAFAFVPLYFGFFLLMSFYLASAPFEWANTAAIIVIAVAVIAAAADWAENFYSYEGLDALLSGAQKSVQQVFWAAHVKWISIFIAVAVVSAFFWRGGAWSYGAGAILLFSLAGLAGLFFYRPLIALALALQFLTILVIGVLFLFAACRNSFLKNPL
jgi:hypothetical protein